MTEHPPAHLKIVSSKRPGDLQVNRGLPREPPILQRHAAHPKVRFGPLVFIGLPVTACLAVGLIHGVAGPLLIAAPDRDAVVAASSGPIFPANREIVASPMMDAVIQNTPGYSEGFALGVPRRYDWCAGSYKPPENSAPPPNFTAVTGWGQVYTMTGATTSQAREGIIEIANARTWLRHKDSGHWTVVQDQSKNPFDGGYFVPDFSPKAAIPLHLDPDPQKRTKIGIPPQNRNVHFWMRHRGTYAAGSVDAVYVEMDIRTTDADGSFVANVGADWWRDATAEFVHGFKNNPGAGMSNWVRLSTDWATLRFYSSSTAALLVSPPPSLNVQGTPVLRRRTDTAAPCEHRPFQPLPKELMAPSRQ